MKRSVCSVVLLLSFIPSLFAQSSAFTYQGRLANDGADATGLYDLQVTVYDAASAGNHTVAVYVAPTSGYSNVDAYSGWKSSSLIEVEEIP